jgi:hypothetical protein
MPADRSDSACTVAGIAFNEGNHGKRQGTVRRAAMAMGSSRRYVI